MTLVELMIVVVIIGILAALSVVGYRRYIGTGRKSEVPAILAEFAAKEQLYFLDNGLYIEAHRTTMAPVSTNENADEFWPHDPTVKWDSARESFPVADGTGNMPTSWRMLGLRPRWTSLYCTYMVNAGCGPSSGPAAVPGCVAPPGSIGPTVWGAAPNVPWFYAMGACNMVGDGGWPNSGGVNPVTLMILTHDSPGLRQMDETK